MFLKQVKGWFESMHLKFDKIQPSNPSKNHKYVIVDCIFFLINTKSYSLWNLLIA
jgi:hypothetical protein